MIRFRCHRCKKRIAVPDGYVGRKVKCPACQIVTIVPDVPSDSAKAAGGGQGGGSSQQGGSSRGAGEEAAAPAGPVEGASQAMTDELAQLAAAMGGDAGGGDEEQYEAYEQVETYEEPAAAAPQRAAEAPKPRTRRSKSKGKSKRTAGGGRSSSPGGERSSSQAAPPSQPIAPSAPHQPAPSQPAAAPQPTDAPATMSGADMYGGAAPSPRAARTRTPAGAGYEWIDWLAIGLQSLGGLLAAGFLYSFIKFIIGLFSSEDGPKLSDMMTTGQKIELYAMSIGVILAYLLSAFILFAAGRVCYVFKRMAMKVDRM